MGCGKCELCEGTSSAWWALNEPTVVKFGKLWPEAKDALEGVCFVQVDGCCLSEMRGWRAPDFFLCKYFTAIDTLSVFVHEFRLVHGHKYLRTT